jgi:ABC-2 type transport system ATP-binding protein
VRDLVKDLSREGRTIFLSTHNLSEAESLCRRIAVVKTRLLALDTVGNLRNRLFQRHVIVRLASVPKELVDRLKVLPFIRSIEPGEQQIRFELDDPEKDRPALIERIVTAGGKVMGVQEEQHSLEDVYLNLVHEANHDG